MINVLVGVVKNIKGAVSILKFEKISLTHLLNRINSILHSTSFTSYLTNIYSVSLRKANDLQNMVTFLDEL